MLLRIIMCTMKRLSVLLIFLSSVAFQACNKQKIGYTVPVVDPTNTYDNRSVGVSAKDFLSAAKYKVINIDIVNVQKHELPQEVIDDVVNFIKKYCNKPSGVNVYTREVFMQGGNLGENNLIAIEEDFRTKFEQEGKNNADDTVSIFIYVSEANYFKENVLGIAYRNTSIALFDGPISKVSGGLGQPSREDVLKTVLRHEIGHLLGLVNIGTAMQAAHEDQGHKGHCDNTECLMYYTVQTTDFVANLLGGNVPDLDANCQADLRANGGK